MMTIVLFLLNQKGWGTNHVSL